MPARSGWPSPQRVLSVRIKVGDAQRALRTKISTFEHRERPDGRIPALASSLPIAIAPDVALVGELLQFRAFGEAGRADRRSRCRYGRRWRQVAVTCEDAPPCKGRVTPAVLKQLPDL